MSDITEYKVEAEKHKDSWLGQVLWYSVPEETIDHSIVEQALTANSLDRYVPAIPRSPDVFRRACKMAERRFGKKDDDERYRYSFESIDKDLDMIFVKLTKTTIFADRKDVELVNMANVTFHRDTDNIHTVELPDMDDIGREVIATLVQTFDAENGKINSAHIRRMIQSVLRDCMATSIRPSGGIYFVRQSFAETIENLESAIADIPNTTTLHSLGLEDNRKQRDMLLSAVDSELSSDMDSTLGKILETVNKGDGISSDQFTRLTADLHYQARKSKEYADLLSGKLEQFGSRQQIAKGLIERLTDLVEE